MAGPILEESPTLDAAEALIYREARLLDERQLEEWLELFSDGGIYWIPMSNVDDPVNGPSICYDDAELRERRVYRLLHTPAYSQIPPSETVHVVSNLETHPATEAGELLVMCALTVHELRGGDYRQYGLGESRVLAGRCIYRLIEVDGQCKIALKKVCLLSRDMAVNNLSFII